MALRSPSSVTTSVTLTLPDNDGNANQVLATNGSGVLSWANTPTVINNLDGLMDADTSSGTDVLILGVDAGTMNSGNRNVGLGGRALQSITTGEDNVAVGARALSSATTGTGNIAIGLQAGDIIGSGSGNILIGQNANAPVPWTNDHLNIGSAIYGDLSNGNIGIGTSTPGARLDVLGGAVRIRQGSAPGQGGEMRFLEPSGAGNNYAALRAPDSITADYTLILPAGDGVANQVLATNGSGILSWTTPNSGTGDFLSNGSVVMTGALQGFAGTTALPGYTFSGDLDTGITNPAADSISFSTQGSARLFIGQGGRVGIGTTSPAFKFDVDGVIHTNSFLATSNAGLGLYHDGNGVQLATNVGNSYAQFGSTNNTKLALQANGSDRLTIATSGNVGIGTTAPSAILHVEGGPILARQGVGANQGGEIRLQEGTGGSNFAALRAPDNIPLDYTLVLPVDDGNGGQILSTDGGGNLTWTNAPAADFMADGSVAMTGALQGFAGTTLLPGYSFASDPDTGISNPAANNLALSTSGFARIQIDASGNVGIGTAPAYPFTVYSTTNNSAVASFKVGFNDNAIRPVLNLSRARVDGTAPGLGFGSAIQFSAEGFTDGTYGSQGEIITIWERTQSNDTSDRDSAMIFGTGLNNATTEKMRISSAGNVGIGTAAPTTRLHVDGGAITLGSQHQIQFRDGDNSNYVSIRSASTVAANITLTLPDNDGSPNQLLATDGDGILSWTSASAADFMANGSVAMTGALLGYAGTTLLPGYSFSGDTDTGITRTGANEMALVTRGTDRLHITSSGNIGMGTNSPTYPLHMISSVAHAKLESTGTNNSATLTLSGYGPTANDTLGAVAFHNGSNSQTNAQISGANDGPAANGGAVIISTGSGGVTERMRVTSTGAVVIGATSASTKLHVAGGAMSIGTQNQIQFLDADDTNFVALRAPNFASTNVTLTLPADDGTPGQVLNTDGSGNMNWVSVLSSAGGSVTGSVTLTSGNLGVTAGSISAANNLNSDYVTNFGSLNSPSGAEISVRNTFWNEGTGAFTKFEATKASADIQRAYIGAVSTFSAFSPALVFGAQTSATSYTERMRISQNGHVGIGTTAPSVSLDISGRTDAIDLPGGTTAERPATPSGGMIRYNTSTAKLEGYEAGGWTNLNRAPARNNIEYFEDFIAGPSPSITAATSVLIGKAMHVSGAHAAGTITYPAPLANRPGIIRTYTGTTANVSDFLGFCSGTSAGVIAPTIRFEPTERWTFEAAVSVTSSAAGSGSMWIGLMSASPASSTTQQGTVTGAYFEGLTAAGLDTMTPYAYRTSTYSGGGVSGLGVTFHTYTITFDGATLSFFLDGTLRGSTAATASFPYQIPLCAGVFHRSTATGLNIDVDYISWSQSPAR